MTISSSPIATAQISTINDVDILSSENFLIYSSAGKTSGVFILEAVVSETTSESFVYDDQAISISPIAVGGFTSLSAAETTIRASTRDWTGNPDDSERPNIHFIGRLADSDIEVSIPVLPNSQNRIAISSADFSLANMDGAFDGLINNDALQIDNRSVNVYLLPARSSDFSEKAQVFNGVGSAFSVRKESLQIRAQGLNYSLSSPMLGLYGGTGGGDGTADMAGLPIMEVYGQCLNLSPQIVDPSKLIYRFHSGLAQSVDGVYVRGAPITLGTLRADYSALSSAAPAAGTYDYTLTATGSFIRLGSNPDGIVTMDAKGDAAGGYVNTVPEIIKRLLLKGIDGTKIDAGGFASMAAISAGASGVVFSSQITIEDAASLLANGIAAFWGDKGGGIITIGRLNVPTQNSGYIFDTSNIYDEVVPDFVPDDVYPAVYRALASYAKNWSPLSGQDIVPAPTISETRRTELQQPYKTVQFYDQERLKVSPKAKSLPILETFFINSSDAQAIVDLQGNLYRAGRQIYNFTVGQIGYSLRVNDELKLVWPRYGLENGKYLKIVRLRKRGRFVTITAFG